MKLKDIEQLLQDFDQSSATTLDWAEDDFHIHLSKRETEDNDVSVSSHNHGDMASTKPTDDQEGEVIDQNEDFIDDEAVISSPMVGLVYLAPDPSQPPYKKVGDTVEPGDVLCVIEAMKMFTEVKSDVPGTITDILVSDGDMVEYDQPLIKVSEV